MPRRKRSKNNPIYFEVIPKPVKNDKLKEKQEEEELKKK